MHSVIVISCLLAVTTARHIEKNSTETRYIDRLEARSIDAFNRRNNHGEEIVDVEVIEAEEGSSIEIPCDVYVGDLEDGVLVWKQGARILFAGSMRVRHDDRMRVSKHLTVLTIDNVAARDAGDYSCQVELTSGDLVISTKSLVVLQSPSAKILPGGGAITVKTSTSLVLTCSGSGVPVPQISWTKDGKILAEGRGQADLPLKSVTWHSSGMYQCHANNNVGQAYTKNFTLNVLHAPVVEVLPAEVEMSASGSSECKVQIQCLVYSAPASRIQWFHNGRLLTADETMTMWNMEYLHVLQLEDCVHRSGDYTCVAENSLGTNQAVTTLHQHMIEVQEVVLRVDRQISVNNTAPQSTTVSTLLLTLVLLLSSR